MFKKETTIVAHSFLLYKHKLKVFDLFLRRRKQHSDRKLFFFYVKKFYKESTQITFTLIQSSFVPRPEIVVRMTLTVRIAIVL